MNRILLLIPFLYLNVVASAQTKVSADTARSWTIHGQNTFLINQSSFSNWAAGGVNSLTVDLILNYDINYQKDKWSWDNKIILGYGLSDQAGLGWRKTDDRIILNSLLGYKAADYWLYTFYFNFQSQFTNGYAYNGIQRTLLSAPFAPAYFTFGPGFAYKKSDNFRINFSPVAAKITTVKNYSLSALGSFGVAPGQQSLFEFGASLDAYYKLNIMQNISFENILKLYSNYLDKPLNIDADYSANIYMKVNKLITVNFGLELVSDANIKAPVLDNGLITYHSLLQVKQIFGAGLTYKF